MALEFVQTESEIALESIAATLVVFDLRKSFVTPSGKQIEVLRGVSFEVKAGETVAIVGASGSGKSTLLHSLGTLEDPDHGEISLANQSFSSLDDDQLAEFRQRDIGFVFQFHHLLPDLTAAENISLPLFIKRRSHATALSQARELLAQMGLRDRADNPISYLSGGEQQRVAVARALITSPKLVLADEPTGNLDAISAEEIGKILRDYVRRQKAIGVIATHNDVLASNCDRVLRLENGRVDSV